MKQYNIIKKIGEGTFGTVYKGIHNINKKNVAIKVANQINKTICQQLYNENNDFNEIAYKVLKHEAKILNILRREQHFPRLKWFGNYDNKTFLVMDILNKNLLEIDVITKIDILLIGYHCINILKTLHIKKILHRDIKPENFMFGNDENKNTLYLIDFGLSKFYMHHDKHIEYKNDKKFIGNKIFASLYTMKGIEYSRRDDLISLSYMLIFLFTKKLPWTSIDSSCNSTEVFETILNIKERYREKNEIYTLCKKLPLCIEKMLIYAYSLNFKDSINYNYLIKIILSDLNNLNWNNNFNFSWNLE
jgi:serine/threonine protein kinase